MSLNGPTIQDREVGEELNSPKNVEEGTAKNSNEYISEEKNLQKNEGNQNNVGIDNSFSSHHSEVPVLLDKNLETEIDVDQSQRMSVSHDCEHEELSEDETFEKKLKKSTLICGNESEDENTVSSKAEKLNSDEDNDEPMMITKKKLFRKSILNSDSEVENDDTLDKGFGVSQNETTPLNEGHNESHGIQSSETYEDNAEESRKFNKKKHNRIINTQSDSEDENEIDTNKSSNLNEPLDFNSVQDDKIQQGEENEKNQKKKFYPLCDPESSDENISDKENCSDGDISETELTALQDNEVISSKGRNSRKNEDKPEKMTAKKALEERKEILAESQRRVRESRVSLPYHKPKQKSLKEFLMNRPKLADPLGGVSSGSSASVRMSIDQLKIITKKIQERKKMVEEFYKSESESEHEEEDIKNDINNPEPNTQENTIEMPSNEIVNEENKSELELMNKEDIEISEGKIITENLECGGNSENQITDNVPDSPDRGSALTGECQTLPSEQEKGGENQESPDNVTDSNTSIPFVSNSGNPFEEKSGPSVVITQLEDNNDIEKENNLDKTEKIILLSNIVIEPTNIDKKKHIYNLDVELLELASETEKHENEDCDNYEFNLEGIDDEFGGVVENMESTKEEETFLNLPKRRSVIPEELRNLKPRLSVGPNQVIDLENGVAMPDEISQLKEKFMQHNLKPEKYSHRKEMSITSIADGQIHRETLSLKIDDNEDEDMKPLEKPGVRMQKLREELQLQMAQRRSDLWKEKNIGKSTSDNLVGEIDGDIESECKTKDILDIEDEEDFTDTEEEDEELEEDYCDKPKKKQKKSDYVDDEAEESEIEAEENESDGEENEFEAEECENRGDDIDESKKDVETDQVLEEKDEILNAENDDNKDVPKKRILKRIKRPVDDDSEDENGPGDNMVSSLQPTNFQTKELFISPQKSDFHFATPVNYMTGIHNLNTSGLKFMAPEETFEENQVAVVNTQDLIPNEKQTQLNSQTTEQSKSTQDTCPSQVLSSPEVSTQQLREVFTGSMKSTPDFNTQDIEDICSGAFTGVSQPLLSQEKDVALDDNDEHLISQLIDEDELENFKKKFESPGLNSSSLSKAVFEETNEVFGTGGVIESDDEEEELKVNVNKKRKRLTFSDEEDNSVSDIHPEETIDLQDEEGLDDLVDYDSEENEVDQTKENEFEDGSKKEKLKASDFFEQEAELSESEWGSEDEDERNLDDMEFEKGDDEQFDESKLRTDIEKLQMKQMLDEDNREVKILQEMLLEDGELHGSGRQRQFRWKNIDATDLNADDQQEDDEEDVYIEEDESEEQFRKERHRREMLKLQQQSQEEDSLIIESQSLTFAHKSLKIKSQHNLSPQVTSSEKDSSPKIKQPFTLLNKRGSFLSRGEKILQNLAESSKISFTSKNANRITFQTIDEGTKKRKAPPSNGKDSTPVALKRLRLSGLQAGLPN